MKTVASKVDDGLHSALIRRCGEKGCSPSEYIRELLKRDVDGKSNVASIQQRPILSTPNASSRLEDRKQPSGYCRGYHIDPETGLKILSRPARVANDSEIKELLL